MFCRSSLLSDCRFSNFLLLFYKLKKYFRFVSSPPTPNLLRFAVLLGWAGLGWAGRKTYFRGPLSLAAPVDVWCVWRPNSAEQAWRSGETEEEMIAKKLKELQLKAQRRDHNKGDPAWKQKEKERLEMMEKEKHLQGILQHPLAVHRPSLVAKHKVADSFFSPLSLSPLSLALSLHGV